MVHVDPGQFRDPCSLILITELAAAEQACGVAEETGAHGVALSGYGVAARTGFADIAGHKSQVDDGLRRADRFIALVDTHGPPEGYRLAVVDQIYELCDLLCRKTRCLDAPLKSKGLDELCEFIELVCMFLDELVIDPIFLDQHIGNGVHQDQVCSGL